MPPTDPPPPDAPPVVDEDAASPPSAAPARRGRPGVSREQGRDAIETWVARTGRLPSLNELRTALGGTGSLSTLSPILRDYRAEQLLAGSAPAPRSPEAALAKAVNAALGVLAAEASEAAEAAIAEAVREADARVTAADARRTRAENATAESDLARERALGRVGALEERAGELRADLDAARDEARTLREGQLTLTATVDELRARVQEREHEVARAVEARDAARREVVASETALQEVRTEHAAALERLEGALGEHRERLAETGVALARAEEREAAAAARAEEAVSRGARLETERDAARERGERLDGALEALNRQAELADSELDAVRRTCADLAAYTERLRGRLVEAGVALESIEPPPAPRLGERQGDLTLPPDDAS